MKAAQLLIAGLIFTLASAASATPSCNHQVNSGRFSKTAVAKVATAATTGTAASKAAVR
jgi:hypothetical protein